VSGKVTHLQHIFNDFSFQIRRTIMATVHFSLGKTVAATLMVGLRERAMSGL
jgi:hypothetical protein